MKSHLVTSNALTATSCRHSRPPQPHLAFSTLTYSTNETPIPLLSPSGKTDHDIHAIGRPVRYSSTRPAPSPATNHDNPPCTLARLTSSAPANRRDTKPVDRSVFLACSGTSGPLESVVSGRDRAILTLDCTCQRLISIAQLSCSKR